MKRTPKKWYPIPPYKNEGWKILNEDGELVAVFEEKEECEIACELFNEKQNDNVEGSSIPEKAIQFLKYHEQYENYINEKVVLLNNKGFKYFPKEISYLKNLEHLDLENNQITHLPKEISKLKNDLKALWIIENPLKQTKEEISKLLYKTNIYI